MPCWVPSRVMARGQCIPHGDYVSTSTLSSKRAACIAFWNESQGRTRQELTLLSCAQQRLREHPASGQRMAKNLLMRHVNSERRLQWLPRYRGEVKRAGRPMFRTSQMLQCFDARQRIALALAPSYHVLLDQRIFSILRNKMEAFENSAGMGQEATLETWRCRLRLDISNASQRLRNTRSPATNASRC